MSAIILLCISKNTFWSIQGCTEESKGKHSNHRKHDDTNEYCHYNNDDFLKQELLPFFKSISKITRTPSRQMNSITSY
jgi:hypothetical protein